MSLGYPSVEKDNYVCFKLWKKYTHFMDENETFSKAVICWIVVYSTLYCRIGGILWKHKIKANYFALATSSDSISRSEMANTYTLDSTILVFVM